MKTIQQAISTISKKAKLDTKLVKPESLNKHQKKDPPLVTIRRKTYEKLRLNSYLSVCVDVGQINKANNLLLKCSSHKAERSIVDVSHFNTVMKGWAKSNCPSQMVETRMKMLANQIEPNAESFAFTLLGYSKISTDQKRLVKKLFAEMEKFKIQPKKIFQSTYLSPSDQKAIKNLIKTAYPHFEDTFCQEISKYDCTLMDRLSKIKPVPYNLVGSANISRIDSWADHQRSIESKPSVTIKSVAKHKDVNHDKYMKIWNKLQDIWRKSLTEALDESLKNLQIQCALADKIHIYPYLCSVDKTTIINLLLDEVEINASCSSYSTSTNYLHIQLGNKIMIKYLRSKAIADGSHQEKQKIYNEYLSEYCTNPVMMGKMNSREFIQSKASKTKNYAVYKDRISPNEYWPYPIVASVGRLLYGLILREIKFDPNVVKNPNKEIQEKNLVNAFYTAYFQINCSHKVKEEFRAHHDFEKLHDRSCAHNLRFDYSYLPMTCPPMPWLSYGLGGYLTNKSDLVRLASNYAEQAHTTKLRENHRKLYPALDSLNAIGLCPWIVNKEILDLVIHLFRKGGDTQLSVPLEQSKMEKFVQKLDEEASLADKILSSKLKKKHDQNKKEMYSLWRDCLYRLSIANHFRDKIFWFPHNMDFRGRTYPIPPHFNHLGADLARSLLLFAKGEPLGPHGLDWLKVHLINLVGKMKKNSQQERLAHANSILHSEVLDSADNPWDGKRWWQDNENPWQVLACCKEIAKAIRSKNHEQYVSHLPIHQDGSCNGLQHYAALGRDYEGGLAVNLVPSDRPQDVYSRVVSIVEKMRAEDAEKGVKMARMLEGVVERKVIKQTVMTTVYGVTQYGARHQIARQLTAKKFSDNEIWQAAQYLCTKTFLSIGQMFNKSKLIQSWLTSCAHIIASQCHQPVSWETPLGFPVTQPYTRPFRSGSLKEKNSIIRAAIPLLNDPLAPLNTNKQKNAFPPNFIHSLDSSHMMLTSLYCQRSGITFVSVHDCFWTHPSTVDVMNRICREQFVALHTEPILEMLSRQFTDKFINHNQDEKKKSKTRQKEATQEQINREGQVFQPSSNSYNNLVNDDLSTLNVHTDVEYEDEEESDDAGLEVDARCMHQNRFTEPLIEAYDSCLKNAKHRSYVTFKEVPKQGDLDLKGVINSKYFFS